MGNRARRDSVACLLLFALNAWICRELFLTEYTVHWGSIEGAYVAISRWVMENWRDLTWFPLWYTGVPFQNSYPPLLHLTVAAVAWLFGITPALAHHAVTATMYCLGSVTLYWLARWLGGDRNTALVAGLVYSLLSPSALLVHAIAGDMGSAWHARRLHALVHYGEGPHVTAITLLPVAVITLAAALEKKRPGWCLMAALAVAALPLTNWLGAAALAAAAVALLATSAGGWKAWGHAAGIALLAYALASPWIPPSTLAAIRENAQRVGGDYRVGLVQLGGWAALAVAFVLVALALRRLRASRLVQFACLFFLLTGVVTLAAEWCGLYLLPQPHRYHLEMEMGLALLAGGLVGRVLGWRKRALVLPVVAMLVAGALVQLRHYRSFAKGLIQPATHATTIEYRMARWFAQHMGERRVMAPGSVSFWMNAFSDTPQLGGGFEQGITNPWIPAAIFQIYSGMNAGQREGEIAVLWLKALGVHAVAVGGPRSREHYKPFANPEKFRGLLEEMWRDGDDVVYRVPQRSASLARVVPRDAVLRQPLLTAVDVEPLRPLVAALDDASLPVAAWKWNNRHHATITGQLRKDHVLSIAISYHPGWRARVNGIPASIGKDGLGLMLIEPECEGTCVIELEYTGGLEMALARLSSWAALVGTLVAAILGRSRKWAAA